MKSLLLIPVIILLASSVAAGGEGASYLLAGVERGSGDAYKGLSTYVCDVRPSNVDAIIQRMTANMPPDMKRPEPPKLRKYWDRAKGMVVVPASRSEYPYMDDMVKRMSRQFSIDLDRFFFPADSKVKRSSLLKQASVRSSGKNGSTVVLIEFAKPVDIGNLFFKSGLAIPTANVERIEIEFSCADKDHIRSMTLLYGSGSAFTDCIIVAEYERTEGVCLLKTLRVRTSDGSSLLAEFSTVYSRVQGYFLPVKQTRLIEGTLVPDELRQVDAEFSGYLLNVKLPAAVFSGDRKGKAQKKN